LRLIVVMYMREPGEAPAQVPRLPWSMATAVALCAAATLYLGIWPNRVLEYALRGAQQLLR
jgi:NADH:ubiquinone oxidoreductase subunit 2 (subunit N)